MTRRAMIEAGTCCRGRCQAARFHSTARKGAALRRSHWRSTSAESHTIATYTHKSHKMPTEFR